MRWICARASQDEAMQKEGSPRRTRIADANLPSARAGAEAARCKEPAWRNRDPHGASRHAAGAWPTGCPIRAHCAAGGRSLASQSLRSRPDRASRGRTSRATLPSSAGASLPSPIPERQPHAGADRGRPDLFSPGIADSLRLRSRAVPTLATMGRGRAARLRASLTSTGEAGGAARNRLALRAGGIGESKMTIRRDFVLAPPRRLMVAAPRPRLRLALALPLWPGAPAPAGAFSGAIGTGSPRENATRTTSQGGDKIQSDREQLWAQPSPPWRGGIRKSAALNGWLPGPVCPYQARPAPGGGSAGLSILANAPHPSVAGAQFAESPSRSTRQRRRRRPCSAPDGRDCRFGKARSVPFRDR